MEAVYRIPEVCLQVFFVVAVVDVLVPAVVIAFVLVLVVGLPVQLQVVVVGDELAVAGSEHHDVVVVLVVDDAVAGGDHHDVVLVLVVADVVLGPNHRFAHKNVLLDDEEHLLGKHHGIDHKSVEEVVLLPTPQLA